MVSCFASIKNDPMKYDLEKKRVSNLLNKKYRENEEYRLKRIEYQKNYRLNIKKNKEYKNDNDN